MIQLTQSIFIGYTFREEEDFSHLIKKLSDSEVESSTDATGNVTTRCIKPDKWVIIFKDRVLDLHDEKKYSEKVREELGCGIHETGPGGLISFGLSLEEDMLYNQMDGEQDFEFGHQMTFDTFYGLGDLFDRLQKLKQGLEEIGLKPKEPVLINCVSFGKGRGSGEISG